MGAVVNNSVEIHTLLSKIYKVTASKYTGKMASIGYPVCFPSGAPTSIMDLKASIDNYSLLGALPNDLNKCYWEKGWNADSDASYVMCACYMIASYAVDCKMPPSLKELQSFIEDTLNKVTPWKTLAPKKAATSL